MKKTYLLNVVVSVFFSLAVASQETSKKTVSEISLYAGLLYGGCDVNNPISFLAGIQRNKKAHFSTIYDVHYWNTRYAQYSDKVYSVGHFSSVTPSIKFIYNTGKQTGRGIFIGLGIGYMIARDRGTEQTYSTDPVTDLITVNDKNTVKGRWDFNSIAPSVTYGIGFRLFHFPVALTNTYYIAKNTDGWNAITGGIGLKITFKKY